jgi:hypothetical protein
MLLRLCQLRKFIQLSLNEISNPTGGWKYFHITPDDRGEVFTFTPQIPAWNSYTDAEDFTTPRVSLATSVNLAIRGKFGSDDPSAFGQSEMFIYAARYVPQMFLPKTGRKLGTPDNQWGSDWSYHKYAIANGLSIDKQQHAAIVKGLVSDDPLVTGEIWSLAPIKMALVGRLWLDDSMGKLKIRQKNKLRHADLDD